METGSVLTAMTSSSDLPVPLHEAARPEQESDRVPLDHLVKALNQAVARKRTLGIENMDYGT